MDYDRSRKISASVWEKAIFNIATEQEFNDLALSIFYYQAKENPIYRKYLELRNFDPASVGRFDDIPFLPIEVFKHHRVCVQGLKTRLTFRSSGTTGSDRSVHELINTDLYDRSILKGFESAFGPPSDWVILALLPSYLERNDASLVYYANLLIEKSNSKESGFYLDKLDELAQNLKMLQSQGRKVLLLGVTFALLDLINKGPFKLNNTFVMETGGMKGKRRELTREELHEILKSGFGTEHVVSEYGMTELLSQAYSMKDGNFKCPPWMKISIRMADDPYSVAPSGSTGGINIIDLANIYSCAFIATQDLGKLQIDGSFEVLGRFDFSDLRGCNLMIV